MARSDYSRQLKEVTFRCATCRTMFSVEPARIEDAPDRPWHPYSYFAPCECGLEAEQASWERNAIKGWCSSTGPKTAEGKAAVTANLDGHPTPEETLRTRFNAMKHGLNAKTATYFPARPGKYSACDACDIDWSWCSEQAACTKQTQLFMLHHAAFESRDPRQLTGLYAGLQSAIFSVLQQILQTIIADGVKIEAPQWYTDKETNKLIIAEYTDELGRRKVLTEIEAHPLFKPLGELLSKNNLSLADMGMTAKVIEDEQAEMGRLESQAESREALGDFARRQATALENLQGLMDRASSKRDTDPILIEYQQQNGGGASA